MSAHSRRDREAIHDSFRKDAAVAHRMIRHGKWRIFPTNRVPDANEQFVQLGERYLRQAEYGMELTSEPARGSDE